MDLLKLFIDDLPFSINNALEIFNIADSDFSIFLFGLEFEFYFKDDDLRVNEILGLLFKSSIREGLLEGNSTDKERIVDGSTGNLFYTDEFLI